MIPSLAIYTAIATLAVGLAGCVGTISASDGSDDKGGVDPSYDPSVAGPSGGPGQPTIGPGGQVKGADCTKTEGGASPVRRLTRVEYDNTVRDLLGDSTGPARDFVADGTTGIFKSNKDTQVTPLVATQYLQAAETLAANAVNDLKKLVPCSATAMDDACAKQFIVDFGKRAYRRPLRDGERDRLVKLFATMRSSGYDFKGAIRVVVEAVMQSPSFLNHVERGEANDAGNGVVALTQYEVASRLSYLIWKTMPDAKLMTSADEKALATPEGVELEARRMLADDRAKAGVVAFYQDWLELDTVDRLTKDAAIVANFTGDVAHAMRTETESFVTYVMWQGDRKLDTLLTGSFSVVNEPLAKLYGVGWPGGTAFQKVDFDPKQRGGGLLTQLSFLAGKAHTEQTSPVKRGKFVRERLLCSEMQSPPPDVNVTPPKPDPSLTTRQRFAEHEAQAYCAGCHKLMDPIGLGFEHFDAVGRYRDKEGALPIDASGKIIGSADVDGDFNGVNELATKLAGSNEVRACVAKQWFRYAVGHNETAEEACSMQTVIDDFATSKYDMRELLVAVVKSDAFRNRKAVVAGGVCP